MTLRRAGILCLAAGAAFSLSAGEISRSDEKTFDLKPGGSVAILADEGDVEVRGWNRDEARLRTRVTVWARRRDDAEEMLKRIKPDARLENGRLTVREPDFGRDHNQGFFDFLDGEFMGGGRGFSIDYSLDVPAATDVRVDADEGDVALTGLSGRVDLVVDEGDVQIENLELTGGRIEADEGNVRIRNIRHTRAARLMISVDEADIRLADASLASLEAEADEGNVVLENVTMGSCRLSADEGDIIADFTPDGEGPFRAEADEGDVRLTVPEDASLDVDCRSDEGDVRSDFDLDRERTEEGGRLYGRIGDGKATLRVIVSEGNITLMRRARKKDLD
ncbi:DUF4097 family beta strand repeat protein [bacterium]|nr:DUF4097 family beta strand repeat protein [bacterium]